MIHVVAARPNFIKMAPVIDALAGVRITQLVVHTGQHYDVSMSDAILADVDLPVPDIHLEVGQALMASRPAAPSSASKGFF